ncbi:MAG: metallophosphoesterase family protein [Actinomycetota bacterium]
MAAAIAAEMERPSGIRILHVTDLHNRLSGFRFCSALIGAVTADVVVDTGDLSGLGSGAETLLVGIFGKLPIPRVFVAGNHDSGACSGIFRNAGACVMDEPAVCEVAGVRFWGHRDPNRTRLFQGRRYDNSLCVRAAETIRPSEKSAPVVAAVHNERMVLPGPSVPLVLGGHFHLPKVYRKQDTVYVRTGSTGGGGPFGSALHASVIDVDPGTYRPRAIWLVSADRGRPGVIPMTLS